MKRSRKVEASIASLATVLLLAAVPEHLTALAQSPDALPGKTDVPSGTTVTIDGSSSMATVNQERKQRFEQQHPHTEVKVGYGGTDAALQSVLDGKTDLAAIGRPLTATEKNKGLVIDPLTRHKIAIVVGSENPFAKDLTYKQFAKIFRGEITNWSEVGGQSAPIRVIDRPEASDTRQAFQHYPVFQEAPFKSASNAVRVSADSTDAVIKELGTNGIGYAIADQVTDKPGVRIVPMHKTLPNDPRYPFSQPLAYVYKQHPTPGVVAFLGNIAAPAPLPVAKAASPQPAVAPAPSSDTNTTTTGFPWWLLLIPLIGGLLWWLLKRRSAVAPVAVAPPVAVSAALPLEAAPALDTDIAPVAAPVIAPVVPVTSNNLNGQGQQNIKLYEERLIAEKTRQKTGDISVGKRVETETQRVSVPIEKERVVIEVTTPNDSGTAITPGDMAFREGEVTRMNVYEETPDIHKEAFVREEIKVRKEVDQSTVKAEEQLRREELDVTTKGHPAVDEGSGARPGDRV